MESPIIAANIQELIAHLTATHQEGDLYRGQDRDYPVLAPSFFRSVVTNLSAKKPIVDLDPELFDQLSKKDIRMHLKYQFMGQLIGDFGIGLGNILAQQYGLGSETIDVSTNIRVAAYFATRKYPDYAHINEGTGVIYRFRQLESDRLKSAYNLLELSNHFEMGMHQDGFFDFFVDPDKKPEVFERDKWWTFQRGSKTSTVCTLRFVSDHSTLRQISEETIQKVLLAKSAYNGHYQLNFNWERTRFFAQSGGLIRPRVYWEAEIPAHYQLAGSSAEACQMRTGNMPGPRFGYFEDPRVLGKFPLFIPSAAIKRKLVGIENMRMSPNCEVHLFHHSTKRVTGFYRRNLWPEPSDDFFYGAFWQTGIRVLMEQYGWEKTPPVDDAATGILDRGYYVANETGSQSGRNEEDFLRGQMEDALENQAFGIPTAQDYFFQMGPTIYAGDFRGAVQLGIKGLRLNSDNADILCSLALCFLQLNKNSWAEKSVNRVIKLAPKHVYALYLKAMSLTRAGNFPKAIAAIKLAIEAYKQKPFDFEEYSLMELRGILSWVTGDASKTREIIGELIAKGYNADDILPEVIFLKEKFPIECSHALSIDL